MKNMLDKVSDIMEYVKSANLKGNMEIIGDDKFLWDLDGIFLSFLVDNRETTVLYSSRKNIFFKLVIFMKIIVM